MKLSVAVVARMERVARAASLASFAPKQETGAVILDNEIPKTRFATETKTRKSILQADEPESINRKPEKLPHASKATEKWRATGKSFRVEQQKNVTQLVKKPEVGANFEGH